MKKPNFLFLALVALAIGGTSMSSCKNKNRYPENPTNNQVYVDQNGNRSVWNSATNMWMIYAMMNGRPAGVYYYNPYNGSYQNSNHQPISRPAHLPAVRNSAPTRSSMTSSRPTSGSSSSKSAGFGSSGKGSFSSGS